MIHVSAAVMRKSKIGFAILEGEYGLLLDPEWASREASLREHVYQ
jgi:hypothetical protein